MYISQPYPQYPLYKVLIIAHETECKKRKKKENATRRPHPSTRPTSHSSIHQSIPINNPQTPPRIQQNTLRAPETRLLTIQQSIHNTPFTIPPPPLIPRASISSCITSTAISSPNVKGASSSATMATRTAHSTRRPLRTIFTRRRSKRAALLLRSISPRLHSGGM